MFGVKALIFSLFFVIALLVLLLFSITSAAVCDKSKCPGPLRFYEDLECLPIYKSSGDCCAIKYDCSRFYNRSVDKCYANGTEYAVGEEIIKKDNLNPCLIGCYCKKDGDEVAKFLCSEIDCFYGLPLPGCYFRRKLNSCCSAEQVCPKTSEDVPTCLVDGKTYKDGEIFYPNSESKTVCQCLAGYSGKNVLPYCRKSTCGIEESHSSKVRDKCAPLYYSDAILAHTCTSQFRCQKDTDTVINPINTEPNEKDDSFCEFGSMKLRVGEELSQSNDFSSKCVKCTCQVPPTLTCQRLRPAECKTPRPV